MAIFTECKGGEGLSPLAGVVDERKLPTNYRALLRGLDSFTRISASRLYLMSGNKGEACIFTILQPVCWHSGLKGQPSNLLTQNNKFGRYGSCGGRINQACPRAVGIRYKPENSPAPSDVNPVLGWFCFSSGGRLHYARAPANLSGVVD